MQDALLACVQGIDSQYMKYSEEASGFVLDSGLRLGPAERSLVKSMLEMGWLYTQVVLYTRGVEGEQTRVFLYRQLS